MVSTVQSSSPHAELVSGCRPLRYRPRTQASRSYARFGVRLSVYFVPANQKRPAVAYLSGRMAPAILRVICCAGGLRPRNNAHPATYIPKNYARKITVLENLCLPPDNIILVNLNGINRRLREDRINILGRILRHEISHYRGAGEGVACIEDDDYAKRNGYQPRYLCHDDVLKTLKIGRYLESEVNHATEELRSIASLKHSA